MDGLVTTFAIVTGAVGAALSPGVILIVGFANVLADAFSMGASSYLSAVSENSINGHNRSGKKPLAKGFVTFNSFALVGLVPLLPFLAAAVIPSFSEYAVRTSIFATLTAFAAVGYISGSVLDKNPFFTAFRNVVIGGIAASIAFGVGHFLGKIFGV